MLDSDWQVWPMFVVELIAFLFLFLRADCRFLGLQMRSWIVIMLLGIDVAIGFSVAHDSSTVLNLHF
ncbi:MAG: hypothetical protein COB66_03840 [Coxiella sp. (in: Bacteria)]|nr:MAG: hypothetical protein COB66_03840 [Coxiella sp. (in: g-proteobacteria)]